MMETRVERAARYRETARQMREMADAMRHAEYRRELQQLAARFERLADAVAETASFSRAGAGDPCAAAGCCSS